jgi:hypothetical protein
MVKVSTIIYAIGDSCKVFGSGLSGISLLQGHIDTAGIGALIVTTGLAIDAAANRISQPGNGA